MASCCAVAADSMASARPKSSSSRAADAAAEASCPSAKEASAEADWSARKARPARCVPTSLSAPSASAT
jgi:hypothetical protein